MELFVDDVIYRLSHTIEMIQRVIDDNGGIGYCYMRLERDCTFLHNFQIMVRRMEIGMRKYQQIAQFDESEAAESFAPEHEMEPKELYYLLVREFVDTLEYIVDGTSMLTLRCF